LKLPRLKTTHPRNHLIELFSYYIALCLSIVLFISYLWAYLFNGYSFSVNINIFGEAHWELVLLCGVMLFLFYGLILRCKELRYEKIR